MYIQQPMPYSEVKLGLSPSQLKRLKSHQLSKWLTLKLKPDQLNVGPTFKVPLLVANRIKKASQLGRGVQVKLSPTCLQCNQRGGNLALALSPLIAPLIDEWKSLKVEDRTTKKIDDRLEWLRNHAGEGLEGGDIDPQALLSSFLYGFSRPMQGLEFAGRELLFQADKALKNQQGIQVKDPGFGGSGLMFHE